MEDDTSIMDKYQYQIIYADPPWNFKTWSNKGKGRSAENHYKCMSLSEIKALPISTIVDPKGAVLLMWSTYPHLPQALETMNSWGFTYKTVVFTWVKQTKNSKWHIGNGYYTRANPEICLLGTYKNFPRPISHSVRNLVVSQVREHSRKPDEVRDRIVELFGDLPRIELFSRQRTVGWDGWGLEYPKEVVDEGKSV